MSDERTIEEISATCDKACEILKKTNDGDLLDPRDLKLTESAVNGYLNENGQIAFDKLHQSVINGTYTRHYLHDIEHITHNHEGYIFYKGIQVEHYDRDYVYSEDAKNSLLELKRRCEFLESRNIEVSIGSAIWKWEEYADEYGAERLKEMDELIGNESLQYSRIEIYNSFRTYEYFICGKPEDLEEIRNHPVTKSMIDRYFDDEYEITVKPFVYGNRQTGEIKNRAGIESLLASCHSYLINLDKLEILPEIKHKTDFAAGYENANLLNSLLDSPGRSLQYSEVFMYGYGSDQRKLYICGIPTFDEVKEYHEYQTMLDLYGDRLNVSVTTFQYGSGELLKPEEMPHIAAVAETLYEAHYYLQKHELSVETGWKDFTRDVEVKRVSKHEKAYEELEYEDEMGVEL